MEGERERKGAAKQFEKGWGGGRRVGEGLKTRNRLSLGWINQSSNQIESPFRNQTTTSGTFLRYTHNNKKQTAHPRQIINES
jgi:hypothetical protein